MKKLKFVVVLLAFVGFFLNGCSDNSQSPVYPTDQTPTLQEQGSLEKCTVTKYTATYYPTGILDPGTTEVVNGKLIIKGQVIQTAYQSDNQLVNGELDITTTYASLDLNTGSGPLVGKFKIIPNSPEVGGGVWEGIWWGSRKKTGESEWTTSLMTAGQGKGGSIKRMQLYSRETIHFTDLFGEAGFNGESKGYIKSHKQ